MIVALVEARLRGVDVRVILPAENDINGGQSSNLVTANYLLKHGVRVYFYPGMTHVKAMLADGWVCFGSANFNTLSLRLNQEADLATSDAAFAARFRQELFETDFDKSYELKERCRSIGPIIWRTAFSTSSNQGFNVLVPPFNLADPEAAASSLHQHFGAASHSGWRPLASLAL